MWDLIADKSNRIVGLVAISLAALLYSGVASAWFLTHDTANKSLFYGLLAVDRFSNIFRIIFAIVTAIIVVFSIPPIPQGTAIPDADRPTPGGMQGEFSPC